MKIPSLNPLSPFFLSATGVRNWLFERGWLTRIKLNLPVISVGNVTMGGTGKTPAIHWLLEELLKSDFHPGVVSRNYRASGDGPGWVNLSPGSFKNFGDEAVLLKMKNPTVPIISGPRKWESALKIEQEASAIDVILVDDGFQHRKLFRDLDIVLLDASVGKQDYDWPPFGRARESLSSLKRAHVVVFTRWEQRCVETVEFLRAQIPEGTLLLYAEQIADSLQQTAGRPMALPLGEGQGNALGFCGLGNPESFRKTLGLKGVRVGKFLTFADHATYDEDKINQLVSLAKDYDYLITSEKDMVKLQSWPFQGPPLYVIPMHLKITGDLERFREKFIRSLRKDV